MRRAIDETTRRRQIQKSYNKKHKITPQAITKEIRTSIVEIVTETAKKKEGLEDKNYLKEYIRELQFKMDLANRNLQFDEAIRVKEEIDKLKKLAKR